MRYTNGEKKYKNYSCKHDLYFRKITISIDIFNKETFKPEFDKEELVNKSKNGR